MSKAKRDSGNRTTRLGAASPRRVEAQGRSHGVLGAAADPMEELNRLRAELLHLRSQHEALSQACTTFFSAAAGLMDSKAGRADTRRSSAPAAVDEIAVWVRGLI